MNKEVSIIQVDREDLQFSTSSVIREMQIKTILKLYLIPVRRAVTKISNDNKLWHGWERDLYILLVGTEACAAASEISLEVSQKIRNKTN